MKKNHSEKANSPRNVLVTGGGGFLGKAIVTKLLERGDRVASFSRSRYAELDQLNVEQVQGDLADEKVVLDACRDRDMVFHVAAKAGVWGPYQQYYQANVCGTKNVIAACRKNRVGYLIHTSSPSVIYDGKRSMEGVDESAPYPDSYPTSYQKTKAEAERMVVKASGDSLKTIILRPHLMWGPGDNHLIPRILARSGKLAIVGDGTNLVDIIYIDDAADGHLLAGEALMKNHGLSGRIYFLNQGEPVNLWGIINDILKAGKLPSVNRSISKRSAFLIGAVLEFVYNVFALKSEPKMTRFLAHELSTSHWFSAKAAERDLGYHPKITTAEGLNRLEKWLEDKPYETD